MLHYGNELELYLSPTTVITLRSYPPCTVPCRISSFRHSTTVRFHARHLTEIWSDLMVGFKTFKEHLKSICIKINWLNYMWLHLPCFPPISKINISQRANHRESFYLPVILFSAAVFIDHRANSLFICR